MELIDIGHGFWAFNMFITICSGNYNILSVLDGVQVVGERRGLMTFGDSSCFSGSW